MFRRNAAPLWSHANPYVYTEEAHQVYHPLCHTLPTWVKHKATGDRRHMQALDLQKVDNRVLYAPDTVKQVNLPN